MASDGYGVGRWGGGGSWAGRTLRENWIAGAGPDAFAHEPLPDDHPLRTLPNVPALLHLGHVTRRNDEGYFPQAVEGIAAFLAGGPIRQLG